jgi:hypothetical protein
MSEPRLMQSTWLSAEDVGEILAVAGCTILRWADAGLIPHVRLNRVVRFHPQRLEVWLETISCHGLTEMPAKTEPPRRRRRRSSRRADVSRKFPRDHD